MNYRSKLRHSVAYIQEKLGKTQPGTVGIVTGSGLGGMAQALRDEKSLEYADIPGFPISTVKGHAGRLVSGTAQEKPALVLEGRCHLYEGFPAEDTAFGIRVLHELGVRTVVLTNAAGALNPIFETGAPMLIRDHINFTGQTPLCGPNHEDWGPRFPDMSTVYDRELAALAEAKALELGLRLERGTYIQVPGPCLETPAETRMYRMLGADAIGMSTVMEAIAAHHMGMRILGLSCLTNRNLPDCMEPVSHESVLARAEQSSAAMTQLVLAVLKEFA